VTDGTFIYIINGSTFCPLVYSTNVYRYDPSTDTYTQLSSNNVGTWNQTAVYLKGKIYKMGGENATDYQTALEIYDTVTDTWSFGTPLPEPTGFASSWTVNGLIYVAGGVVAPGVATNAILGYDPVTQAWFSLHRNRTRLHAWGASEEPRRFPSASRANARAGQKNASLLAGPREAAKAHARGGNRANASVGAVSSQAIRAKA
jgi:hypothetical protein